MSQVHIALHLRGTSQIPFCLQSSKATVVYLYSILYFPSVSDALCCSRSLDLFKNFPLICVCI
uniref:Uncharacterized protein n=1 Tax=Anguilla anguilla TaxID=7936 RepID=A0A0E9WLN0_ANGAN